MPCGKEQIICMEPGSIITLVIGGLVGLSLIAIGIHQMRKRTPVAFYSGEEPPAEACLKSVRGWNTGHGLLWVGYGLIVAASYVLAVFLTADPLYKSLLLFCGTVLPILLLVAGHRLCIRKYLL